MKNKLMAVGLLLMTGCFASAQNTVGSGGDALRAIFEKARTAATYTVENLDWCHFPADTDHDLQNWLLNNKQKLKTDLKSVQYRWVVDVQPTCGFTNHSPESPLYLSYVTCAQTVGSNLNNAIFTILHETAHHLGISDERMADQIAVAIQNTNAGQSCSAPVSDVFSPSICQGADFSETDARKYLSAGQTESDIDDKYKMYARARKCTLFSGCAEWVVQPSSSFRYDDASHSNVTDSDLFIRLSTTNNNPYYEASLMLSGRYGPYALVAFHNGQGTKKGYYLTSFSNGNKEITGDMISFKSSCLWRRIDSKITWDSSHSDGSYEEEQFVIYGTH